MRRIIFLDIDGVLGYDKYYEKVIRELKGQHISLEVQFIDEEKCKMLNMLYGAEIVISGSWGYDNGLTEERLRNRGLKLPITDYTKKLHYQHDWAVRGNEIKEWIERNIPYDEDFRYVIIDDDADMLLEQADNFVHIDHTVGITDIDLLKIKEILEL